MKQEIHITVGELVAHVLRSGDLELGFSGTGRPLAGIRAHQQIQQSRPDIYCKEVAVRDTIETEIAVVEISGRIDGVFQYPDSVILEEIKSTSRDLAELEKHPNERHWAQLKLYAYLYARTQPVDHLKIQLTYFHAPTGDLLEIGRDVEPDDLAVFFDDLLTRYLDHVAKILQWRETRDLSIRDLPFPYAAYRSGQRELAVQVYRIIDSRDQMLAQAPTGIGKTVAVLFPAVKAIVEKKIERIFYLTARSTGKTVAEETLVVLRQKGLRLRSVTLTAKEKICFNPGAACTGDECEFARGYYDRIDAAVDDALKKDSLDQEGIASAAWTHKVCPFELSLDAALWADCIIGDYNYAFDPYAYLKRFFLTSETGALLLCDEAHNLVDRSRDMFSAELWLQEVIQVTEDTEQDLPGLHRCLEPIGSWLRDCRQIHSGKGNSLYTAELPQDLVPLLQQFTFASDDWLSGSMKHPRRDAVLDMHFKVSRFLKAAELFDDTYAVCHESINENFKIKLFCIDPSQQLRKVLEKIRAAVFFSATLTPVEYYHKLFGCNASAKILIQSSPFPHENLCLLVDSRISTYFKDREMTKEAVAASLETFVRQKRGNYLIFFPSYEYMAMVGDLFCRRHPHLNVMMQSPSMTEAERNSFLKHFKKENQETLVGFVVLGGVFGEGIDLLGDRLTGVVVVTVGQPPPTPEREVIQSYFDERYRAGYEFAYVFPGFNRVLQACGRVIRSERDRGSVLLMDMRYSRRRYTGLFPSEWRPVYVRGDDHMARQLNRFWEA